LIRFEPASAPAVGVVLMQRIYVGNLSFQSTEQTLSDLFGEHGTVNNVSIITDRVTGRSRGFAFIEMNDDGEAKAAMEALNGHEFDGRALKVAEAKERADSR
ncbi:MAG: RNA recognition motif domain-containing protein, partial [Planctomycetota bacterium]